MSGSFGEHICQIQGCFNVWKYPVTLDTVGCSGNPMFLRYPLTIKVCKGCYKAMSKDDDHAATSRPTAL